MTRKPILPALVVWLGLTAQTAIAQDVGHSAPAVHGYDLVSYHTGKRPLRGNGHFVAEHGGATYLFVNAANLAAFERNPEQYLPAYGGWCAFGVSVGKKFVGDPEANTYLDRPRRKPYTLPEVV